MNKQEQSLVATSHFTHTLGTYRKGEMLGMKGDHSNIQEWIWSKFVFFTPTVLFYDEVYQVSLNHLSM